MQYDHLGPDHASVANTEQRGISMADLLGLSIAVCIMEVSLIRRAKIERFHCISYIGHS